MVGDNINYKDEQWGSHIFLQSNVWQRPLSNAKLWIRQTTLLFPYHSIDMFKWLGWNLHDCWFMKKVSAQQWQHSISEGVVSKMRATNHNFTVQFDMVWKVNLVFDFWYFLGLKCFQLWQKWQNYFLVALDNKIYLWEILFAFLIFLGHAFPTLPRRAFYQGYFQMLWKCKNIQRAKGEAWFRHWSGPGPWIHICDSIFV